MVKVAGFAAIPTPQNVEDWLCLEENDHDTRSQMRGLETIFAARYNCRSHGFACTESNQDSGKSMNSARMKFQIIVAGEQNPQTTREEGKGQRT